MRLACYIFSISGLDYITSSILTDNTILFMSYDEISFLFSLVIDFLVDLGTWPPSVE